MDKDEKALKICVCILIGILIIAAIGIGMSIHSSQSPDDPLTVVRQESGWMIAVDKETKVMYYIQHCPVDGITVMLNADGTPKIWKGELE